MPQAEIAFSMQPEARDCQDGFALMYRRRRTTARMVIVVIMPPVPLLLGWWSGHLLLGLGLFLVASFRVLWLLIWGTRAFTRGGREMQSSLDPTRLMEDFFAGFTFLRDHPASTGKVGAVGFCHGGGRAGLGPGHGLLRREAGLVC